MAELTNSKIKVWLGTVLAVVLVVLFFFSIGTSPRIGPYLAPVVDQLANNGIHGQVMFIVLVAVICLTGVIPASTLAILAGTVYGAPRGAILSAIGLSIGGVVGFLAARFLIRDLARRWVDHRPSLRKIDTDIARLGWKIVALLRLSPVAPFGITSYAFGLTQLKFGDYLVGTIGSLPAMVGYVYIGALLRAAINASTGEAIPWVRLIMMGVGVAATITAAVHFYRVANQPSTEET